MSDPRASHKAARYGRGHANGEHCGACRFYFPGKPPHCEKVVDPMTLGWLGWCRLFKRIKAMAMVSLKKPKSAKPDHRARIESYEERERKGPTLHLEHHHLMALKDSDGQPIAGRLRKGHRLHVAARGEVESASTRSDEDGTRHSAVVRLHRAQVKRQRKAGEPSYPKEMTEYLKERG